MTFDTLSRTVAGVSFRRQPRAPGRCSCPDSGPEATLVIARKPKFLLLTLAVSAALVGCKKDEAPAATAAAPAPEAAA